MDLQNVFSLDAFNEKDPGSLIQLFTAGKNHHIPKKKIPHFY